MSTPPPPIPPPGGHAADSEGSAAPWSRFRAAPPWVQVLAAIVVVSLPIWLAATLSSGSDAASVEVAEAPEEPAGSEEAEEIEEEPAPPPEAEDLQEPEDTEQPEPDAGPEPVTTTTFDADLEFYFFDVGQADATLLLHDEAAILIDAGHWQRSDVVPYLDAVGVEALDLLVVTHPHADHIGQFTQVVDAVDVAEVWWSGATTTTQTFERALDALERSDAAYEEPRTGDTTTIGPLAIDVANPPPGVGLSDLHDSGLALRITYGDVRLLFTGDAEAATEARMVSQAANALDADILQLGHHGSSTSTTAGFLAAVDPAVAIYSAGAGNQYGHPHDEVIARVQSAGIEVYGTDVHGTVLVTSDGQSWSITTDGVDTISAAPPSEPAAPDPGPEPEPQPEPAPASDGCDPGQVDINRAEPDALQEIIHIGPDRAEQIQRLRPFASVRAMDRISGIGPARLEDIIGQGVACAG
jgi:competence protein ComEC